jgi:hypothetical protein
MYAMEGFPSSGIEIIASPLTLDIRKEIDAVLKKAVAFVDQQQQTSPIEKSKEILSTPGDSQKALAGISVDPTNVIAPLIEKISMDLINGLNMGMIDPLVIAAIAYAENKWAYGRPRERAKARSSGSMQHLKIFLLAGCETPFLRP